MQGIAMVEFAIVCAVLMTLLFACFEFGRAMYTLAALNEGTRRAARLAAVCPVNDPSIAAAVNFLGVSGFNNGNVSVGYLDANGASLGVAPPMTNIRYVRVSVVGYTLSLVIPFANQLVTSPPFTVTLPAESLGLSDTGVLTAC
jgi:Flp pilus assembly protein TadG